TPLFVGAIPKFADIDLETFNMDTNKAISASLSEDVKGIIAVDIFGQPIDISTLKRKLKRNDVTIIEDSCEALGSELNGHKCGTLALAGAYAFYPNKQITTGEGGIIVTDNRKIYEYCKSARSQGRAVTGLWLEHERLGYNFRMSELNAALGVAQTERLDEILEKRNRAAGRYYELLRGIKGITLPHIDSRVNFMSWFVFVIRISKYDNEFEEFRERERIAKNKSDKFKKLLKKTNNLRNALLDKLMENGIGCKPYFTPIHLQKFYRKMFGYKIGDFPVTEYVGSGTVAIPFFTNITLKQQKEVAKTIRDFFN
ncbi:MAG: polysaccharide biosynthesis protein, partial [Proteobacteria bacterium]|nr:polysaccharide biosynthesis protein [Pseudomonadota bacterium]